MRQIPLTPEQIAAEFLFEGFYCAAQGWLGDMALLSSSCKIQGPGNCQEISNLMHFHWNSPTLMEPGAPTLSYRCANGSNFAFPGFQTCARSLILCVGAGSSCRRCLRGWNYRRIKLVHGDRAAIG